MTDWPTVSDAISRKVLWAVVFALIFALIGTAIPLAIHTYSPASAYVDVQSYEIVGHPQVNDTEVQTLLDRRARTDYRTIATVDISRVTTDYTYRVGGWERTVVVEAGQGTRLLVVETPPLTPGIYQVTLTLDFHVGAGVNKQVTARTQRVLVGNVSNISAGPGPPPEAVSRHTLSTGNQLRSSLSPLATH